MNTKDQTHPVTSVLSAVVSELAYLLQTEVRMARAEIGENIGRLKSGGAMLAAAAVILLPGLVVLCLAVARWLTVAGMTEEWSLTLVAVVVLVAGAILAWAGINALRKASLVPERTIEQMQADFSVAKEQVP